MNKCEVYFSVYIRDRDSEDETWLWRGGYETYEHAEKYILEHGVPQSVYNIVKEYWF